MLRLIIGPAGTGKTGKIYKEIQDAVAKKEGGRILIVPEQFSHEAERELCGICGDTLSRYAEVLSFTGLARAVEAELGGGAVPVLDKGGKLLCMSLALNRCREALQVFAVSSRRPEMQSVLLSVLDTMRTSCISSEMVLEAAQTVGGELENKLKDIAVIYEAYRHVLGGSHVDPADALLTLASRLSDSCRINENSVIYIDGFTDFTMLELEVLRELLGKHVTLNVCLTLDGSGLLQENGGWILSGCNDANISSGCSENMLPNDLFTLSRLSAVRLIRLAQAVGEEYIIEPITITVSNHAVSAPIFLAENVFSGNDETMDSDGTVKLIRAGNITEECRTVAAEILTLIREKGFRYRDIALAIRGFEEYAPLLESAFEEYGIPLFTARRIPMSVRPLPLLLSCIWEILSSGWKTDDLISYMGTGLSGLTPAECDVLSSYIYRWQPGANAWRSTDFWQQHPDGYGKKETAADGPRLAEINRLRDKLSRPILMLERTSKTAHTASALAAALYDFLAVAEIPAQLDARAEHLSALGKKQEAEEYMQIWNITVSALEQVNGILGDMPMEREQFFPLFLHMLSSYDIGTIPVSLDSVIAGDFNRMRRRNLRCLFVLGASADRLPRFSTSGKLFTDDELMRLDEAGACIGENPNNGMWREYALIYNCLSLPSEKLWISYAQTSPDGSPLLPSLVMERAEKLFSLPVQSCDAEQYRTAAFLPALRAAASGRDKTDRTLRACMELLQPDLFENILRAASATRGKLSAAAVEQLYGRNLSLSASRAEKFFSCPYEYFASYGLKVRPYKKAVFDASEVGNFTHFVLEHVLKEIGRAGNFREFSDEQVRKLCEKYIRVYESTILNDFAEKTSRFIYLFRRTEEETVSVVLDTVHELSCSDFVPAAFEFDISELSARIPLPGSLAGSVPINGRVDRIDVWISDGKAYLRIGDYKTGGKDFTVSDLWYGTNMQMVLYLDALCRSGKKTAELLKLPVTELRPAGVEYIPACSKYVSVDAETEDRKILDEHKKLLKRKGLVLSEDGVPGAWERDGKTDFSPVKYDKSGDLKGDSVVSAYEMELLSRHVTCRLQEMADSLASGNIDAFPYRKDGDRIPCDYCDMNGRCGFIEGENGECFHEMPKLSTEDAWNNIRKELENDA